MRRRASSPEFLRTQLINELGLSPLPPEQTSATPAPADDGQGDNPGRSPLLPGPTTAEPAVHHARGMAGPGPANAPCGSAPRHLRHDDPGKAR
ncbi:MAG: hypothetical protein ACRDSM_17550 [Pseudonocardiaceae bacterium]